MTTLEAVAALLTARNLSGFLGLKEDEWFDAKGATPYDLNSPQGRMELAKDVSSFANAGGGYIVCGLSTTSVPEEQTDQVDALALIPQISFNASGIQGVLKEYLYPKISYLQVKWVEDADSSGLGVGAIFVPSQSSDNRFVLMKQVLDGDTALPQTVFGLAVRRGGSSKSIHRRPTTPDLSRRTKRFGRTPYAVEAKLDSLIRNQTSDRSPIAVDLEGEAQRRLERILGNE